MATITARQGLATARNPEAELPQAADDSNDLGIPRFFYAAAAALVLSGIQGAVQRLPGISDWLRDADYGGHMVTNLALTHITIVGAGTISLTGLMYYVLPKITHQPLYSKALCNISFWATLIGVFGFYLAMLGIGIYEGAMVHAGWPYEAARDWMGAWHKGPMALTAAIMGIGYWTFVANVYATAGRAVGVRKLKLPGSMTNEEALAARFFVVSATGLLFGTVQGVYQVLPWSLDWLRKVGEPGMLIDPMAHAHMNLVAGVSVGIMGLFYFFLPRMTGRPIFSLKLGQFGFWCTLVGVFSFYLTAVSLGLIEGGKVLDGMTADEAKASMGIWHPLLFALSAATMGVGFWSFITNILLTLRGKPAADAPVDGAKLRFFIRFSVVAILVGTIQGVIQILGPVENWLDAALPSSYFVTPLAHAQLNMVGFAIVGLMAMSIFLLPRLMGRPATDPVGGRRALAVVGVGIVLSYLAFLGVGLLESIAIHNGVTPDAARLVVGGVWGRYVLFTGAQAVVGIGYFMLFRHISKVIGKETIRAYYRAFWKRMRDAGKLAVHVHPRALPANRAEAQRKALTGFGLEAIGMMGLGWFYTGRPFIGIMLMSGWVGFLTILYLVVAIMGNASLLFALLVPYFVLAILSGLGCYRSYMRDAQEPDRPVITL